MTPLARHLVRRIAQTGPMTLADFMGECLVHPEHGYYSTRDPLGANGDFTTAPEISQMFGECLGLALARAWRDRGAPGRFALTELGPGRGTLMADVLRATRAMPGFLDAAEAHLIEVSPALRARQAESLAGRPAHWHSALSEVPELPLFLVANEFFDALPIRQFQRDGAMWRERMVGRDSDGLILTLGTPAPFAMLEARLSDTRDGDIVEVCEAGRAIAAEIGTRIASCGGAAIIVDYGGWHSLGDTLQAVRGHAPEPILANPGEADLTAHVDFAAVAEAARQLRAGPLVPQGPFLERLGVTARAQVLAQGLRGAALRSHVAAHRRLTHPDEMGNLFKVLAFAAEGTGPLPGIEA